MLLADLKTLRTSSPVARQRKSPTWFEIEPSDTKTHRLDALFVGSSGDVTAVSDDGDEATFVASAGTILPISGRKVKIKESTTATSLVGLIFGK